MKGPHSAPGVTRRHSLFPFLNVGFRCIHMHSHAISIHFLLFRCILPFCPILFHPVPFCSIRFHSSECIECIDPPICRHNLAGESAINAEMHLKRLESLVGNLVGNPVGRLQKDAGRCWETLEALRAFHKYNVLSAWRRESQAPERKTMKRQTECYRKRSETFSLKAFSLNSRLDRCSRLLF